MVGPVRTHVQHGPAQRSMATRPDVTVGQILAQARRQRRLSLETVAELLKIPAKQLRGLEEGRLEVFSAEIYARGAFNKYTDFLGVRADETQHAFLRVLTGAREHVPLKVHRPRSWLLARFTPRWIIAGAVAGVALLVGGYVAWQVASFVWLPELAVSEAPGVAQDTVVPITGTADTSAVVRVNGAQVLLDEKGRWSIEVGLHSGINVIQVQATNAAGRTRTLEKTVLLPRTGRGTLR